MSKVAIFTDTHLGARGGSSVFRNYFEWYYKYIFFPKLSESGVKNLLMLGDFFDNRNHVNLNDIEFVNNVFLPLLEEYDITMNIIAGNHDLAYKNTNAVTSLSVMQHSNYVNVLKDEVVEFDLDGQRFAFVPWINANNYSDFMQSLSDIEDKHEVIVLGHFEINGFLMYKNSSRCETGIDQSVFKDFKEVWSGHFHHPSKIGNVEYIGSLFHLTWQDYGDSRGFYIFDTQTKEREYVENEYCLFTQILYSDDAETLEDSDIEDYCYGQYVKIVIEEEYDKIKFMDFYSRVISSKPIYLQIENNYAIRQCSGKLVDENNDQSTSNNVSDKSIENYIGNYVNAIVSDHDKQVSILSKFDTVKRKAEEIMVKGE